MVVTFPERGAKGGGQVRKEPGAESSFGHREPRWPEGPSRRGVQETTRVGGLEFRGGAGAGGRRILAFGVTLLRP